MRASSLVPWEEEEGGDVDGGGRPLSKVPDVWRGSCWAAVRACLFCRCGGSAFPGLSQPLRLPAPQLLALVRLQSQQAGPCLSHVVPVVLALLPCLLPSKGPGAHSGAPGPPRLALGFKCPLTCSLDSPPRPDSHNLTSSHILGIGLETFRGDEVRGILLPTANLKKKKKHKVRGVSSVLFGAQMRPAAQETAFQMALRSCSKEAGHPWEGEGRSGCV